MSVARVVVAVGLISGCISPVMHFGAGKSAKEAQRDTMSELGPARLVTGETWAGEVATRKIRVWADQQYRAQNLKWQHTFEEPLELANLVLTPLFGLRLEAEYQAWDRVAPSATLTDDLAALRDQDPGADVFAVVGLTSSLPLVSATFDELGLAELGGRYVMLRGYADLEERKLYAGAFPDLRADERELALEHLRHHKTAVVLLHELGHILGVEHEVGSATIMNAVYSSQAASFSPEARAVMLRSTDRRLQRRGHGAPEATDAPVTALAGSSAPPTLPPPAAATHHEPLVVRVTHTSAVFVDGKQLDPAGVEAALTSAFARDPETPIRIGWERHTSTRVVNGVIDRARAIGFTQFDFGGIDR